MAIQLLDLGQEVYYLPINAEKIPYSFTVKLDDKTYRFIVKYNETGGFFTIDLETITGEILALGAILRYGRPLFGPVEDERFPLPVLIPFCPSGGIDTITKQNFGGAVKVYLFPRNGPQVTV